MNKLKNFNSIIGSLSIQLEKASEFYNKEGFNYNNISQKIKEFKIIAINLKELTFNSPHFKIRTVNKKNKLGHVIAATVTDNCFNSIEILYSIVISSDYGAQFIIKEFEESHLEGIGQFIFDSIMAPRFSTGIEDVCYL